MPTSTSPRIAILGAGPIGLEAALYARQLKLPFTIYEQGRVGEHLWRWGHVKLFSPFGMNTTPLGRQAIRSIRLDYTFPADDACISGREQVERYLATYFATFGRDLPPPGLYDRVIRQVEQPLLSAALAATRGNQIRAAELLGLNRNTLRSRIKALDIRVFRTPIS